MEQQQQPQSQPQQSQQTQQPPVQPSQPSGSSVDQDKVITYLSYIGILFLVPMLVKKDSAFAQFHAKQGLVLTVGWFIGSFLYVLAGLGALVHLVILVLSIMGLINVSKGEMKDLPIVGGLAKKINL